MGEVRVRFAPSPTGYLHVGGARTALFNWLFCRRQGGRFVLRLEDTDQERSRPEWGEAILDDLRWLGLDWDEGPDVGGPCGPYVQTRRLEVYRRYAQALLAEGRAYRCFCTPDELAESRRRRAEAGQATGYDRRCLQRSPRETEGLLRAGRPFALRLRVDNAGVTEVDDLIRGPVRFDNALLDDWVIVKSDGLPTYNFAVVVDDHLMEITHVIRGEDTLSNTPRQLQLFAALGWPPPRYGHLPVILGPDRSRLSKRHGATSVAHYREAGFLPQALLNYLALLGWSPGDDRELFGKEQLVACFDLAGVSKNPAVFDHKKLEWMNSVYLRELPASTLVAEGVARLVRDGVLPDPPPAEARRALEILAEPLRARLRTLGDLASHTAYLFQEEVTLDEQAVTRFLSRPYAPALLRRLAEELAALEPFTPDRIEGVFQSAREAFGLKLGDAIQPARVALTGTSVSPPMYEVVAALGKERTLRRLRRAVGVSLERAGS